MSRIDEVIANVGYIIDVLRAYRNIIESGNCNTCANRRNCEYVPKPGQIVRYNCQFYKEEGTNDKR